MAGVVRSSMCTYTKPTPTLVSGTGLVDEEVIPDVAPSVTVHMVILNLSRRLARRPCRIVHREPGTRSPRRLAKTRRTSTPTGARNNSYHKHPLRKSLVQKAGLVSPANEGHFSVDPWINIVFTNSQRENGTSSGRLHGPSVIRGIA